jgi:hypothetical protein
MTPVEKKEFFVSDIQPICEADSRDEISVNLSAIDRISRKEKSKSNFFVILYKSPTATVMVP